MKNEKKEKRFEFIVRKIEISLRDGGKPNKDDIISTIKHPQCSILSKIVTITFQKN